MGASFTRDNQAMGSSQMCGLKVKNIVQHFTFQRESFSGVYPVLRSLGRALFPHALQAGSDVLADLSKGESLKTSVQRRGKTMARDTLNKALGGSGSRKRKAPKKRPVKKRKKKSDLSLKYPFLK